MKLHKIGQIQFIVSSLINCLVILVGLIFYLYKINLNNTIVIVIVISLLFSNILALLTIVKSKSKINKTMDRLEMLEAIIEAAPNAVFVHKKLNYIYSDSKAAELLGLKNPSEIVGKPVDDFVKLNTEIIGEDRMEAAREQREFEPLVEEMIIMKNGEVVQLEMFSTPIKIKDSVMVLVICKNITEKKRILELEKKIDEEEKKLREKIEYDKLKDEFFSNLSHELRTPLTIILGTIQLLENSSESQVHRQANRYKILKQNGYRLLRLVNNLLDITKIDAGYFDLNMDEYNIVSVVEDITSSVVEYIENKGLYIEFDTEVEEKIVSCHLDSIDRIILNLLSNAVKFTPKGGSIFVYIFDEVDNVKIVIKDTGIGIKEENIDLIFDRFRQVDKSFSRTHEGSGIGLSIVKSLVEMQGGTISLSSEYGKGSEFIIELPVEDVSTGGSLNTIMEKEDYIKEKINIEFSDI
ncbi:PAS domain-containing sensor histidine kinase [Oceanirhabdus seepicola]|uniref:histidine kinase n=1 Tax=Oceanirhabdus seepicola TaxID=2828781 RepID=A0A9J6P4A1_9CLOT|nr:PAS domain-containing sensor histidine kinase [Oceanirhabdus seepicola]MCM1991602.1 PAS domain-containing sensor histidine kinase [Oceanirhabdus seepicola]